jgi:hypothetical protein
MDIPEETEDWCDRFARFVAEASKLTAQGNHPQAVACFAALFELVEAADSGDEIIFAEEAGSWMIPTDQKGWLKSYLTSLAATATPGAFTAAVIPMLQRDSGQSFIGQVHASALTVANAPQKAHLQVAVQRQRIRTGPS